MGLLILTRFDRKGARFDERSRFYEFSALYSSELRRRIDLAIAEIILSFTLVICYHPLQTKGTSNHGESFLLSDDEPNPQMAARTMMIQPPWRVVVAFLLGLGALLPACGSSPRSLSIKMVNPETQMTLMCNARDDLGANRDVLANVVETCARQLEARGFLRAK